MSKGTVISDRDQRVTVGPHVVNLKAGKNEVPATLVDELTSFPGVTTPDAKQEEPEKGAPKKGSNAGK